MEPGPLSVIKINGTPIEKVDFSERVNHGAGIGGLIEGDLSKGSFGKFLAFNRLVGMSVEGFEREILALCWRLESRKKGRSSQQEKKKVSTSGSRFDRELCYLLCSINYDSTSGIRKRGGNSLGNFVNCGDED